jgi:hypothetical protein
LPKKIEFQLLLADLALQLGNAFARLQLAGRRPGRPHRRAAPSQIGRLRLARSTATAQGFRTAGQETIPPHLQILARKLQLTRQGAHVLARQHPVDDAELERSAENAVGRSGFGHPFSSGELSRIFRVSLLGCTPGKLTGNFSNSRLA